jgi:pyridoxine 5-phosphate synthase
MVELGVNIDHVATIRQARRTYEPDPVAAVVLAELGGADGITVHLREDRRHIQDRDILVLKEVIHTKFNFELSCAESIVDLACRIKPDQATLVPEKREEVTTEGGLDMFADPDRVQNAMKKLQSQGIAVAMFLDPEEKQIEQAKKWGAVAVELHTGQYANAFAVSPTSQETKRELGRLQDAGKWIVERGMNLHAGHGLNYHNVTPVAAIDSMLELNIGHSIVSRAVFVGLERAVREMKQLLNPFGSIKHL